MLLVLGSLLEKKKCALKKEEYIKILLSSWNHQETQEW